MAQHGSSTPDDKLPEVFRPIVVTMVALAVIGLLCLAIGLYFWLA